MSKCEICGDSPLSTDMTVKWKGRTYCKPCFMISQLWEETWRNKCPICNAQSGFEVKKFLSFTCKSCLANWQLHLDFFEKKDLLGRKKQYMRLLLELVEPSKDGRGGSLKGKKLPLKDWLSLVSLERAAPTAPTPSQIQFCYKCGAKLEPEALFCHQYGVKVQK